MEAATVSELRETGTGHPKVEKAPRLEDCMEPGNRCAYNQTRRCILGVEIASGDFSHASLADQIPALVPKSGAGLWIVPFKGIPATDVLVPLDLIYLGEDCRVIETVEFYPTFRVSPSSPPATSVLALPPHSIFASHTQPGDQLVFGLAEEIESQMNVLSGSMGTASAVKEAPSVREEPLSSVPAPQRGDDPPKAKPAAAQPAAVAVSSEPFKKASQPKNWLQRLLAPAAPPEPRKASRAALPGLIAHFWTGGSPQAHDILNISSTGLYVRTEERWYPGTLIQMTLKKTGSHGTGGEASISLLVKANRWGNDGVGLGFVVRDPRSPRGGDGDQAAAIDREILDRFLAKIGHGNGEQPPHN
jgi:hypothetical protein